MTRRKKNMNPMKNQKGCSIIAAVFIIVIMAFMGVIFLTMVNTASFTSVNDLQSARALYVAEGGIEKAMYQFTTGTICNALSYTNALGPMGSFTTVGTMYNLSPSTTLSAAITNVATVIPVASTVGYAPQGRIIIESEVIEYTTIVGNSFSGVQRAAAGTVAAAHANGQRVAQNLCLIQSTGTVGSAVRVVERTVEGISSAKQGSFAKLTTGTGSQSVTGVGFRPVAVIFFWTRQTAGGFALDLNAGVGFATGPANERAVSIAALNNSGRSDDGRRRSQSNAIIFLSGGGPPVLVAQAGLTSLDADGFTLNWTTNDNQPYIIHYIALGGDVSAAFAGTFNLTTGTGNLSVAGVGFQPDFVMFLWSFTEAVDTNTTNAELGIGFAKSAVARGALVTASRDNILNNLQKRWQQRTDSVILLLNPAASPPSQDAIADFASLDADGFTINKSNAPAASTPIFYLALKGGNHSVGAFNQRSGVGSQTIAGIGFKPEELMLASFNLVSQTGIVAGGSMSLGAAQSMTNRGGIWFEDKAIDPSDTNMYTTTTRAMTLATGNGTLFSVVNAQADFTSFDTDGFTLNWTTADATARQILYWAVGPNGNTPNIIWRETFP